MSEIKMVVFDMDGVLVKSESFFVNLLSNVARQDPQSYRFAINNGADIRTLMARFVSRLKGMKLKGLSRLTRKIPLTKGAKRTIKELKRRGYVVAVISDGLDVVAQRVRNLDVDFVFSNRLACKKGSLTGKLHPFGSKAETLERLAKKLNIPLKQCAVIGDDVNDLSCFRKAGLAIAYNPKHLAVTMAADHVVYNDDLKAILPIFEQHRQM